MRFNPQRSLHHVRIVAIALAMSCGTFGCLPEPDCSQTATCSGTGSGSPDASLEGAVFADVSVEATIPVDVSVESSTPADAPSDSTDASSAADASSSALPPDAAKLDALAPPQDATPQDAPLQDAFPRDGGTPSDAVITDAGAVVPTWSDFTDVSKWESVAVGIGTGTPGAGNFQGTAFDGRYVYFVPSYMASTLTRYDTQAPFTLPSSWQHLDLRTLDTSSQGDAQAAGFAGAVFDGRFLYLVPFFSQPTPGGLVLQCDTTAAGGCMSPAAWSFFGLTSIDSTVNGYAGAVFDGRYVNFVPFAQSQQGGTSNVLARFDTQAPGGFAARASWSTFQITRAVPRATVFTGSIFDGQRLYFLPFPETPEVLAIYDTTGLIDDANSWRSVDLPGDAGAGWYAGGFDGRYVYLTPAGTTSNVASRCDTRGTDGCANATSWTQFDMHRLPLAAPGASFPQYFGATFDGKYMYFVPYSVRSIPVRFDTSGEFTDPGSWTTFDLSTLNLNLTTVVAFQGAAFDGEYVYLVPTQSQYFLRFDARKPSSPPGPPSWGSFY
jgi:hypothetical protein